MSNLHRMCLWLSPGYRSKVQMPDRLGSRLVDKRRQVIERLGVKLHLSRPSQPHEHTFNASGIQRFMTPKAVHPQREAIE